MGVWEDEAFRKDVCRRVPMTVMIVHHACLFFFLRTHVAGTWALPLNWRHGVTAWFVAQSM